MIDSCPDTVMPLQDKIQFHQGVWVGDRLDNVAKGMTLDG